MNQMTKQSAFLSTNVSASTYVPARLIDISWSHPVALSTQVSLEVLESPEILKIPGSKYYLEGLIHWQDKWIPALNLKALLAGESLSSDGKYALIVLYRYPDSHNIHYGAILLNSISTVSDVGNELRVDLPSESKMLPFIADSCFFYENQSVPILNMQSLFCYSYDWYSE